MPDQTINVDININADSVKQIPQYKAAFDSLKTAVDSLNKTMLKQNEQSKEAVTWGAKFKTTIKDLADTYKSFSDVLEVAGKLMDISKKALSGWLGLASAAFTLITTYGPAVLDYLGEVFQSEKTKQAARELKNYQEVMTEYVENISGEISEVQMLVNVANNENLSKENRMEAIKRLNALSPEYLKNLTLENIKTKEGTALMDAYTKSLNRRAMEEAIQSKRIELVKQRLELKPEYDAAKQDKNDYNTGKKKDEQISNSFTSSFGVTLTSSYSTKDAADDKFAAMVQRDKIITDQITQLDKTLAESLLRYAPKPIINPAQNKAYWETVIDDQQTQLDRLDSHSKTFQKDAVPIIKRIKEAKKELANYSVADITGHHKSKTDGPDKNRELEALLDSQSRMAMLTLDGYAREVAQANQHFEKLKDAHKTNKAVFEQLERERIATLQQIAARFEKEDMDKLAANQKTINEIKINSIKDATQQSLARIKQETDDENTEYETRKKQAETNVVNQKAEVEALKINGKLAEAEILKEAIERERKLQNDADTIHLDFLAQQAKKEADIIQAKADANEQRQEAKLSGSIQNSEESGHPIRALQQQQQLLDMQYKAAMAAAKKTGKDTAAIESDFAKKKAAVEEQLNNAKIHAGDKYINAVLANTKKDSAIYKAAFLAKKATSIADVIISTKKGIVGSFEGYAHLPFIGQALAIAQAAFIAGQGAASIATIAKQKPGFAAGGQYFSDGRGALLPGYSRTDNTNAYLRSGEAVVVSEAMRNPWARNLVSAINVAHGGRDFSVPNMGKGYAVGGIFTDGGNANRYYNQPMNDVKDLANTLAYQMINNFPPIYVDVKDVNNQQNILAQTVNRVNL
ncbi:hypothetical protein [Mucilaginibacter psychrotolerans]|uniref:Uncharacterized protein n=1 Tax=Mucilaginibacter psychrotolerans TaxID=1524096 RepID=A0A4Y8S2F6_9SPHI|nr:hypothetical protein [Mucilaginibacter psychrotolerans]TFF32176.1 hypothetical protein E2R66_26995 [Mucilaginibacter psychrotolerans]